jgi:formate C-acetyltransferase
MIIIITALERGITLMNPWTNFKPGKWQTTIDMRDFIQQNYLPYDGNGDFLAGVTPRTKDLWDKCRQLLLQEGSKKGVLDIDTNLVSTITAHKPGYIDENLEIIVGLQTDAPLKRSVIPNGGVRMVEQACEAYGYQLNPEISNTYHNHVTTHNTAVFNMYTKEMKQARKLGIITGLPDGYGRGRIIGDYRRVALYGINRLIEEKKMDLQGLASGPIHEQTLRLREEVA